MKKTGLIVMLGLFALACSFSDIVSLIPANSTPLASPVQSSTSIPSDTPTITPTLPTPTFTNTPTLVYSGSSPTPQVFLLLTGTAGVPGTDYSMLTPQVGFNSVQISGNVIRWGSCEPSSVKITAYVTDPIKEKSVLLFIRLRDTKSGDMTDWGYGAEMNSNNKGIFTYTVFAKSISGYRDFFLAWVQYQLVAFDRNLHEVGRTQPYLSSLTIGPCP